MNLRETLFWGIELQGAVYNVTEGGVDGTVIPANGFLNFKYKADKFTFRPYAGIGLGLVTAFNLVGESKEWVRHGGFQFQAGIQINALILEFQAQRAFVDGGASEFSILAGFVF